jgi:hypothetical protein
VRAIDSEGYVDLSPATFSWTVNATALDAIITGKPSDPSNSRQATFSFTGTGSGFECALDEGSFESCTSPRIYNNLSYGRHTFQVRAYDGAGNRGAADRFSWEIVNLAPVAADQAVETIEGTPLPITLGASDSDPLTYRVSAPARGVLQGVPPFLTYVPDSGFVGADSFTFVANDGLADSNIATVTITVNRANQAPTIRVVPGGQCNGDTPRGTINLLVMDVDGDLLTLSGVSSDTSVVPNGNIVFGGSGDRRTVTITALARNSLSSADVTIYVSDGNGGVADERLTVVVGTDRRDTITVANSPSLIFGRRGDDTISGGNGNDLICGGSGNDIIDGGNGDDTIDGGDGNDRLFGGAGNDLLIGGSGADFFSGGPGVDRAIDFNPREGDTRDDTVEEFGPVDGFLLAAENAPGEEAIGDEEIIEPEPDEGSDSSPTSEHHIFLPVLVTGGVVNGVNVENENVESQSVEVENVGHEEVESQDDPAGAGAHLYLPMIND